MRAFSVFFALLVATASYADPYRFEPNPPTSASGVVLVVESNWNGCLPRNVQVTRNDHHVDVRWTTPTGVGCVTAIVPWSDRVFLGVLAPGFYDVTLRVNEQTIATRELVVAEGVPAFDFDRPAVGLAGGIVDLQSREFCVSSAADIKRVQVDGADVLYNVDPCSVIAFLPPHAAGPVDISVQVGETTYTVRSRFRYLDEHATPDSAVFERVLIPVLTNGPGAFGSQWVTQATLRNLSNHSVRWFSDAARPLSCGTGECLVTPFTALNLFAFGNRPQGLVLFVPRGISNDVHYGLLVRDSSRGDTTWGSEVRVVREKDAKFGRMVLEDVTLDARYRATLRIYAIDGGSSNIVISAATPDRQGAVAQVKIEGCAAPPCNSAEPGFASFDLAALLPSLRGKDRVTLLIEGERHRQYWALASITNNTTQQVTVISPQ
jgi:hypothetical protein